MTSLHKVLTPRRKALAIAIAALIALYAFISWSNHRGDINYVPVRVEKSAKALVRGWSCQSIDSDYYLVVGFLEAPADSGVIKIGAKVHFSNSGPSKTSFEYSGWTTYFDTSHPSYWQY